MIIERPSHDARGHRGTKEVLVIRIINSSLSDNVVKIEDSLRGASDYPKVLILRLHRVTAVDESGLMGLKRVVEGHKNRGGTVILCAIHHQPLQMLRNFGIIDLIGVKNICSTFYDSMIRANESLKELNLR